jgi:hypothetical protein
MRQCVGQDPPLLPRTPLNAQLRVPLVVKLNLQLSVSYASWTYLRVRTGIQVRRQHAMRRHLQATCKESLLRTERPVHALEKGIHAQVPVPPHMVRHIALAIANQCKLVAADKHKGYHALTQKAVVCGQFFKVITQHTHDV